MLKLKVTTFQLPRLKGPYLKNQLRGQISPPSKIGLRQIKSREKKNHSMLEGFIISRVRYNRVRL